MKTTDIGNGMTMREPTKGDALALVRRIDFIYPSSNMATAETLLSALHEEGYMLVRHGPTCSSPMCTKPAVRIYVISRVNHSEASYARCEDHPMDSPGVVRWRVI